MPICPVRAFLPAHRPPIMGTGEEASWSCTGAHDVMQSTGQSPTAWLQLLLPRLSARVWRGTKTVSPLYWVW